MYSLKLPVFWPKVKKHNLDNDIFPVIVSAEFSLSYSFFFDLKIRLKLSFMYMFRGKSTKFMDNLCYDLCCWHVGNYPYNLLCECRKFS